MGDFLNKNNPVYRSFKNNNINDLNTFNFKNLNSDYHLF